MDARPILFIISHAMTRQEVVLAWIPFRQVTPAGTDCHFECMISFDHACSRLVMLQKRS
jgi:hypothetical protein